MQVKAEMPEHGVFIEGELDATFLEDGDNVLGKIPVLGIIAQGNTQPHAHRLLGKLFAEYCAVIVERNQLWEILMKRGFKIVAAEAGRRGASQYLYITETKPERSEEARSQKREVEFTGAGL